MIETIKFKLNRKPMKLTVMESSLVRVLRPICPHWNEIRRGEGSRSLYGSHQ
jgi:hypothetical protein